MAYRSTRAGKALSYIALVAPALAIYLFVMAYPVINSVVLSFGHYNVYQDKLVLTGLDNYARMFADPDFWGALQNNLVIILASVFGQIPLGFALAYALFRKMVKRSAFFQAMIFLPTVISTIVVGVLWEKLFSPFGVVQGVISFFGGPSDTMGFMNQPGLSMIPILIVMLWMYTGTYLIIFMANLQKIEPSVLEAARIDGAKEGQILRMIVLPAMGSTIVTTIILAISGSLKSFDLIWAMTQGGPANMTSVLSVYMYQKSFAVYDYSLGSAVSTFMVVLSFALLGLTALARRIFSKAED